MAVEKAHEHNLIGHSHEDDMRVTAEYLGWEISHGSKALPELCRIKSKAENCLKEN